MISKYKSTQLYTAEKAISRFKLYEKNIPDRGTTIASRIYNGRLFTASITGTKAPCGCMMVEHEFHSAEEQDECLQEMKMILEMSEATNGKGFN